MGRDVAAMPSPTNPNPCLQSGAPIKPIRPNKRDLATFSMVACWTRRPQALMVSVWSFIKLCGMSRFMCWKCSMKALSQDSGFCPAEGRYSLSFQRKAPYNTKKYWQPLSLCCTVYKILSKFFAALLKKAMELFVHRDQMHCVPGRSMVENVYLILDVFGCLFWSECWLDCSRSRKGFRVTTHLPNSHTCIPFTCISHSIEVRVPHVPVATLFWAWCQIFQFYSLGYFPVAVSACSWPVCLVSALLITLFCVSPCLCLLSDLVLPVWYIWTWIYWLSLLFWLLNAFFIIFSALSAYILQK